MGRENKKWRRCQLTIPNFCVLPALSSHLSVFSKLCIMNTPLHFLLLLCQSCRSLRNVFFGGHILGLIKSAYHGCLSMMTSSESPLFSFALGLPNRKPTTGVSVLDQIKCCCPLDHGTVNRWTIAKLPSQNFSEVVRFKLLLRDISLRTFFSKQRTFWFARGCRLDISFLKTYVNGLLVQWRWSDSLWQKRLLCSVTVAKISFFCDTTFCLNTLTKCWLPNRISFDVFDRGFWKLKRRRVKWYAVALSVQTTSQSRRPCPGPRIHLIRPCQVPVMWC